VDPGPPASPAMMVQSRVQHSELTEAAWTLEGPQCATALELPHLERLVSGGGNGVSAVWNHRHGVDLTSVALEGPQCAASLQLPPFALARRARRLRFWRLETPLVVG
jgi:hypothetical protein